MTDLFHRFPAPLTIGVIADTHVYAHGRRQIPDEVLALFQRAAAGLIVHAGDLNDRTVLDALESIAPVLAVRGNNDSAELSELLPAETRFQAGRFSFVLVHGHQGRTARAVARTYAGTVDCVVYGHSHIPKVEEVDGTVLFNPGSATDRRWGPHFGIGLIRVTAERCTPELLVFADPSHLTTLHVTPSAYTVPAVPRDRFTPSATIETRSKRRDAH